MPTGDNPVLRPRPTRSSRPIQVDFPRFGLSVRDGIFQATWRPELMPAGATRVPYLAKDEQGMRERLRAVLANQAEAAS